MRELLRPDLHLGRGVAPAPPASGRHERRDGRNWVTYDRLLPASASQVWRALTETDELVRWIGRRVAVPDEGRGVFSFALDTQGVAAPNFRLRRVETGRALGLAMWDSGAAEAWHVELELAAEPPMTRLALAHSVVNAALVPSVAAACEFYLDRLAGHLRGDDLAELDYDEYFVRQAVHYRRMFPVQRV